MIFFIRLHIIVKPRFVSKNNSGYQYHIFLLVEQIILYVWLNALLRGYQLIYFWHYGGQEIKVDTRKGDQQIYF